MGGEALMADRVKAPTAAHSVQLMGLPLIRPNPAPVVGGYLTTGVIIVVETEEG